MKRIPGNKLQRRGIIQVLVGSLLLVYILLLPKSLFIDPTCTVLEDRKGTLLGARIADDGQWRFPYNPVVPYKFERAILEFEDKYFLYHPGINPVALMRALYLNLSSGKVKSGGSTLTMQTIRLARKGQGRTIGEKLIEMVLATRAECSYSKKEILALYASHAPYGGNVVGLDAASWRYFGRKPQDLSWAEAATLAVLPNAPSLIYPGKNHERLLEKRNRLLSSLWHSGAIDSTTCLLAQAEPLPEKPFPLPQLSPHLLDRAMANGQKGERVVATLDAALQERVKAITEKFSRRFSGNQVHNAAVLVAEVSSGKVVAYVGNVPPPERKDFRLKAQYGNSVDIIRSPRSTGSIMKPFLYASMLSEGEILPHALVPDVPMQIGSFSPQNFYLTYDGAVPASRALSRSLNVPIVKMLQQYGIGRFLNNLQRMGLTTLSKSADHYGLTLILGGAEATLWELCGVYASMARKLNTSVLPDSGEESRLWHPLFVFNQDENDWPSGLDGPDPASIYLTFESMAEVNRPDIDASWQMFSSASKIAWKTGTSFGFRDGWAIGVSKEYVVGVWIGNASGEGRPELTGIGTAAPVLFQVFGELGRQSWFQMPKDQMLKTEICRESGYRALPVCENKVSQWIPPAGDRTKPCPYHRTIHLDAAGKWRVNSDCDQVSNMTHRSWFVLPPGMEWYYRTRNPTYKELPAFRPDCRTAGHSSMELIYPKQESRIFVPVELDEETGKTVFRAAHRKSDAMIYWHLDDQYMGSTTGIHQFGLAPAPGTHTLTLVDENGESISQKFEIIGKKQKL